MGLLPVCSGRGAIDSPKPTLASELDGANGAEPVPDFGRVVLIHVEENNPACLMPAQPPVLIAIDHDEHYASRVGRIKDGLQVFVTTPFVPASGDEIGREFIAVYIFDPKGKLVEARIDDLGPRCTLDRAQARRLIAQRMAELGPIDYGRIVVQPFAIERFGTTFGLVPRAPEEKDDGWWVEVQPGNYMAFHEPWDSGGYDT